MLSLSMLFVISMPPLLLYDLPFDPMSSLDLYLFPVLSVVY